MARRLASMFVLGVLTVSVPVAGARTTGTLSLSHAVLAGRINQVECPPGTADSTACFQTSGTGVVPGLGVVSEQYLNFVEDPDSSCERWHSNPVLTVRGKGEIDLSLRPPNGCVVPTTGVLNASLVYTVTGGSGIYAGASGQGTFVSRGGPGTTDRNTDTLAGGLTVAGLVFDRTPPVLSGAVSKTALAPRGASAVRVTYKVKAQDLGYGSVAVTCKPRSGSRFKLGRTRVVCSATDDSGNKATARFRITVKR
jgi:HYR domain